MLARLIKLLTFGGGLALFIWLLADVDLRAVAHDVADIGWVGIGAVALTFAFGFASDVASWLLMFRSINVSALWAWRLLLVQMVGEALNVVTPFGSLGGEPFKALLLKRHYDLPLREVTASLLLIQTVNSLAMAPFILTGALLTARRGLLPAAVTHIILGAAIWIGTFMVLVYAALHLRALVALQRRLAHSAFFQRLGSRRLARGLGILRDIEEHLFLYVRHSPARFAGSFVFAFLNWLFGAVEMFLIFLFLGHPIAFADAWMVEATIVLVRAVTFFIPAHLGVQDGAIVFLGQALTGSPEIGLTVALIRRGRELVWTGVGLAVGGWFGLKNPPAHGPAGSGGERAPSLGGYP